MNHSEIRRIFYDFFIKHHHHKVLSSPLVPAKDPTLLFTNAGMNQFKSVFLQEEKREYDKAVTIQKCMRVSGKHNDFDEVGKTEFHHTFFEMMGNFSFGDYFKEKAIELAWDLLINGYKFKPEDLWITVFREDDEAHKIWEEKIGIAPNRILRLDEKDNFWQMGDTGPCGPCSEIHFDRGPAYGPDAFVDGNRRYMEIWNLVFMQFYKDNSGKLNPLPAPSIDTGMGLERLTTTLQGVSSNYKTDLFRPIIEYTAQLAGVDVNAEENQIDLKVIADHGRCLSFLISDGILPANDGRGYVLRRVLRRAAKHGKALGFKENFLGKVSGFVIDMMKDFYPELEYNRNFINEVISAEEDRFNHTLLNGLKRFEELLETAMDSEDKIIPGIELFKLSDTYGFPLDFAVDLANEKEMKIDYDGYKSELEAQKEKSRASLAKKQGKVKTLPGIDAYKTEFTGYGNLEDTATLKAVYKDGNEADAIEKGEEGILVFDRTPFYAESGGQTGDCGLGQSDGALLEITTTRAASSGAYLHTATVKKGTLKKGDSVNLTVDKETRNNIAVHHSTTHLLHAALREVLGLHVKQAGSYVGPDKLRFDFTHFKALTPEEIVLVEDIVNRQIRRNMVIDTDTLPYEEALAKGAMAIFAEKYADVVRMVSMGDFSRELCGGTHLYSTGEAGFFKIVSESSISSGIRRVEAIAGEPGYAFARNAFDTLRQLTGHFNQKEDKLLDHLIKLENNIKEKEKQLKQQAKADEGIDVVKIADQGRVVNGVHTVVYHADDIDRKRLSTLADEIKNKTKGLVVVSTNTDGKSAIIVSLNKDLTPKLNANAIIRAVSELVNGKGGGRPDFAQAGGDIIEDGAKFREITADIVSGFLK